MGKKQSRAIAVLEHFAVTPSLFLNTVQDPIFSFQYKTSAFQPNPLNQDEFHPCSVIFTITGNTGTSSVSRFWELAWLTSYMWFVRLRSTTNEVATRSLSGWGLPQMKPYTCTTPLMISYSFNVSDKHGLAVWD